MIMTALGMKRIINVVLHLSCSILTLAHLLLLPIALAQMQPNYDFDDRNIGRLVVDAINAGSGEHTDANGIKYRSDPLQYDQQSISSDFGRRMIIQRVRREDQDLYQTERYSLNDFEYELIVPPKNGEFVLVLKFCEVYFQAAGQKVFNVILNSEHEIITELDVFDEAGGRAIAHDEKIPFTIKDNKLYVNGMSSDYTSSKLIVKFAKGRADNPKVNALYVLRGSIDDVPLLGMLSVEQQQPEEDIYDERQPHTHEDTNEHRQDLVSGPAIADPYETMDSSQMFIPILVAIAAFFPILYCVCKM